MTVVYLAHDIGKAAELRARIALAEFAEKSPRRSSVDYRIARDYYTHVEGDSGEDCQPLLDIVLNAIGRG